jgi:hypothetical protein
MVVMVFDGFTEAWKCQLFAPQDNGHRDWKLKCPLMTQVDIDGRSEPKLRMQSARIPRTQQLRLITIES